MKKHKLRVTLHDIVLSLQDLQVNDIQLEWKVGKQISVTSNEIVNNNSRKAIDDTFSEQVLVEYDSQSKTYLSCPSSLTLLLILPEGRIKIGGYTLFNLSTVLNDGLNELTMDRTFGSIGSVQFKLQFHNENTANMTGRDMAFKIQQEVEPDQFLTAFTKKALLQWLSDSHKRTEKKAKRLQHKIVDLQKQKKETVIKHAACLQGDEGFCGQQIHKHFHKLQQEISRDTECCKLVLEHAKTIQVDREEVQVFNSKSDRESINRIIKFLKLRDDHIDRLITELAERTGDHTELSIICIQNQKTIKSKSKAIEQMKDKFQELIAREKQSNQIRVELQQGREHLESQLRMVKDKLRLLGDQLKYKEANKEELLDRAHSQMQSMISQSKKLSDKQTQIVDEKERQLLALREFLSSNEDKLTVTMRQNLQLHKILNAQRQNTKKVDANPNG